ncbi:MAG: HAD-IC family P-type ATPase [bacterium]
MLQQKIHTKPIWACTPKEVFDVLKTSKNGLEENEVIARQNIFGRNIITQKSRINRWSIFLNQFKNPLIVILLVATGITIKMHDITDALFILAAVIVNVSLGFYQENKAETALASLRSYIKERVRVIRGRHEREIDAEEIVPGDIIRVTQGTRIPADGKVIVAHDLSVDEAILTGESLPETKNFGSDLIDTPIADRQSVLFGGTLVTGGTGLMVITATGSRTELGKIAELVADEKGQQTPLQRAIAVFTKKALYILGTLVLLLFLIGLYSGYNPFDMFLISVAVAVAAVPEGLPVALTVILAVGVERLAKRKGVVRKLLAAETLGSTTVIITDKTGTLTQAKMELTEIVSNKSKEKVLELALLNTDVVVENPEDEPDVWRIIGNPLEAGIVRSAAKTKVLLSHIQEIIDPEANDKIEILERKPFNSFDKFSMNYVRYGSQKFWSYLGAPERIIEKTDLEQEEKEAILKQVDILALAGHRVLGVAQDETFLGLLAFRDPVRPNIRTTIEKVKRAGIRTVIATGDHAGTAEAVGKEVGILGEGYTDVLIGTDIQKLDDSTLKNRLKHISVFARVTPEDKLRIARLYQEMGEVVAMTGDGVNDAPALKAADIGIAVGSGTDVAKGAADLVMLDDDFETIIAAIEEGRRALSNIRKVIVYLLLNSLDELILIGGSLLVGIPIPINALQILWVNFFSDSFPAIAFAFENGGNELQRKPHHTIKYGIFDQEMKFLILIIGVASSAFLFVLYVILRKAGFEEMLVRTFIFASFGLATLFIAFSVRNLEESIIRYNPFSNKYLIGGVGIGFILMFAAIYVSPLQKLLGTVALPAFWVLGVFAVCIFNLCAIEIGKWLFFKKEK